MKDKRIRCRQAEIAAVVQHKARCFVITRGDLSSADMAQRFIANKAAILTAPQTLARASTRCRRTGSRASALSCYSEDEGNRAALSASADSVVRAMSIMQVSCISLLGHVKTP